MSNGSTAYSRPDPDTIELSLFGRGVGECLAVHLGAGNWLTVDSCLGSDGVTPANLEYFGKIGVPPASLTHILCSHYDRDHIVGLPHLLTFSPGAHVIVPTPMSDRDFCAYAAFNKPGGPNARNPAINTFFEAATKLKRQLLRAHARTNHPTATGSITVIGPSDKEIELFLAWVASQIPEFKAGRSGTPAPDNNSVSLVLLVDTPNHALLLGGDCLAVADPDRGWRAALALIKGRAKKIDGYKIAHHGAASGDCPDVWVHHLHGGSGACLAPFNGVPVPSPDDIAVIKARGVPAFSAAKVSVIKGFSHSYKPSTQRLAERMSSGKVKSAIKTFGHVRMRWAPGSAKPDVELFGDAFVL